MSLLFKPYALVAIFLVTFITLFATYMKGYNRAEAKYVAILNEQKRQADELQVKQKETSEKVVTKYKTQIKTITNTVEKIIEKTPEVLKDENTACTIGPGFISLHDAAANGGSVSGSASGTNGTTKPAKNIELTDVSKTITTNYGNCNEIAARLTQLQDWVKRTREDSLNVIGNDKTNK